MPNLPDHRYFFDDGLYFACQRCGVCCTGAPGVVRVDAEEAAAIAGFMHYPSVAATPFFIPLGEGLAIGEHADGRCRFYDRGCLIHPVRPMQCRLYPFLMTNLRSPEAWRQTARHCPGIGKGRRYTRQEILDLLALDRRLRRMADFIPA